MTAGTGGRERRVSGGAAAEPTAGGDAHPWLSLRDQPDDVLLAKVHNLGRDSELRSAACEILVSRYQKLVRSCVRQYRNSPEPVEDLMQAGYVGLLKAINNYDPAVGDSLSAYALPCVSGEIKRHFRDRRWQVRVRRSAQELMLELRQANEELVQRLGRSPSDEELADRLGVGVAEVREARQADLAFTTYSLDAPLPAQESSAHLADLLGKDDEGVEHTLDMQAVNAHWNELSQREQRILVMRFYGNLTQSEIGERLGISQMHVSRLLARALAHLRSRLLGVGDATETPHRPRGDRSVGAGGTGSAAGREHTEPTDASGDIRDVAELLGDAGVSA